MLPSQTSDVRGSSVRYTKSEPGAVSDRVVSEMLDYAGHYRIWSSWEKRGDCRCVSEMLDYAGHYRIWPSWEKRDDCRCVSEMLDYNGHY